MIAPIRKYWLIAALLPTLWLSCNSGLAADAKDEKPKNPPAAVTIMPATIRTVSETIKALGTVVPFQTVALNARIDSQIMDVKFKAGDFVKKGQPLFTLDDRTLKAELAQAQASLQANKAQIDTLQKQYDRQALGAEKGFASEAARDDAKAALDERKALILSSQAAVDNIKVQLGYTIIVSPIDGRTGTINVTAGNTVRANDTAPLVTINQIRPISVQAALPQAGFDSVRTAGRRRLDPRHARRIEIRVYRALWPASSRQCRACGFRHFRRTRDLPNDDEQLARHAGQCHGEYRKWRAGDHRPRSSHSK